MRSAPMLLVVTVSIAVLAKTNTHKALTESLGQEVIELTAPIKDVSAELDEEPAAENDDDEPGTTTTIQSATKNRKPTTLETRRKQKDEKIDATKLDDEESRIAKELAEIYKDNADYRDDKSEDLFSTKAAVLRERNSTQDSARSSKPVERQRADNFKFQPDNINDKKEVERFRTSVDDISCDKSNQNLADEVRDKDAPKSAYTALGNICLVAVVGIFTLICS